MVEVKAIKSFHILPSSLKVFATAREINPSRYSILPCSSRSAASLTAMCAAVSSDGGTRIAVDSFSRKPSSS